MATRDDRILQLSPPLPAKVLLTTLSRFCCTTNRADPIPLGELFAVKLQPMTDVVSPVKVPRTPPAPTPVFAENLRVHVKGENP